MIKSYDKTIVKFYDEKILFLGIILMIKYR